MISQSTVVGRNYGVLVPGEVDDLVFLAENAFYFKNLEIFNLGPLLGETVLGYKTPLRLGYRPRRDLALEFGVLLGRDFGDKTPLNHVAALVRLIYEPTPGVFIIAGTIMPTHWIADAILDDLSKFRDNVEEGFQLRVDRDRLKNDTWVNWRKREGEVSAEEFEIGLSNQFRLAQDFLRLEVQGMWSHAGGQISTSGRVEQDLTYGVGFSVGIRNPLAWTALKEVRLKWSYLTSRYEDDHSPFVERHGHLLAGHADFRVLPHFLLRGFGEAYAGEGFYATLGDPLYGLGRYRQLGFNMLFDVAGEELSIEAGFVRQWTNDVGNLTYQLSMVWRGGWPVASPPMGNLSQMGAAY